MSGGGKGTGASSYGTGWSPQNQPVASPGGNTNNQLPTMAGGPFPLPNPGPAGGQQNTVVSNPMPTPQLSRITSNGQVMRQFINNQPGNYNPMLPGAGQPPAQQQPVAGPGGNMNNQLPSAPVQNPQQNQAPGMGGGKGGMNGLGGLGGLGGGKGGSGATPDQVLSQHPDWKSNAGQVAPSWGSAPYTNAQGQGINADGSTWQPPWMRSPVANPGGNVNNQLPSAPVQNPQQNNNINFGGGNFASTINNGSQFAGTDSNGNAIYRHDYTPAFGSQVTEPSQFYNAQGQSVDSSSLANQYMQAQQIFGPSQQSYNRYASLLFGSGGPPPSLTNAQAIPGVNVNLNQ